MGKQIQSNGTAKWIATMIVVVVAAVGAASAHWSAKGDIKKNANDIVQLKEIGSRVRNVEHLVIQMAVKDGIDVSSIK